MISRRKLIERLTLAAGAATLAGSNVAEALAFAGAELRGSIDAASRGVTPGGGNAAQRRLQALLAEAALQDMPVFLPPGDYPVSGLVLPDRTRLVGIAGATRLVQTGDAAMIRAEEADRVAMSGITLDGGNRLLSGDFPALSYFRNVGNLSLQDCTVTGAAGTGLYLQGSGGRIERCRIIRNADYGLYAVDSVDLAVADNTVSDCGNGGILIHRYEIGKDGTLVSGNRITRTGARNGGTGQYGNAINLFRANDVIVSGNHITDSAFSAIRANSASNVMIADNHCTGSGETAIYAEFSFEGAMISGNLVDGAANGISVVNFNEGGRLAAVTGNVVRNLRLTGPYTVEDPIFGVGISIEADTAASGNVIENAPFCGLGLGFGPYLRNVSATGNVVRNAAVGCAVTVVEDAGSAIIANNIFQGTQRGGVIGYRWREAVTGDLAKDGAETYPHLTIENNRVG